MKKTREAFRKVELKIGQKFIESGLRKNQLDIIIPETEEELEWIMENLLTKFTKFSFGAFLGVYLCAKGFGQQATLGVDFIRE